ncbi:MAG: hypothetical protein IKN30_03235 [Synergistaceae bacterium]|nr:hypothetical protein [Synergistaceae bacterium]
MFINVERENCTGNLILFTENAGTVYKIDAENTSITPELIGMIHENFEINKIFSQDIKTSEPLFMDINIGEKTFQILK